MSKDWAIRSELLRVPYHTLPILKCVQRLNGHRLEELVAPMKAQGIALIPGETQGMSLLASPPDQQRLIFQGESLP